MTSQQSWGHLGGGAHPRHNTVHVTNLPPDTIDATLLDCIMIAHPFGRVYSLHLRTTHPSGPRGPPAVEALIAFFAPGAAQLFLNYVNCQGIAFHGYLVKASRTRDSSPDTELPDHENASRAIIVAGPKFYVSEDDIVSTLKQRLPASMLRFQHIVTKTKKEGRKVLVVFATYAAAKRAIRVLDDYAEGATAVYGMDPMETAQHLEASKTDCNKNELRLGIWEYPESDKPAIVNRSTASIPSPAQKSQAHHNRSNPVPDSGEKTGGSFLPNSIGKKMENVAETRGAPCPFYVHRPQATGTAYKPLSLKYEPARSTAPPNSKSSDSSQAPTEFKRGNGTQTAPANPSASSAPKKHTTPTTTASTKAKENCGSKESATMKPRVRWASSSVTKSIDMSSPTSSHAEIEDTDSMTSTSPASDGGSITTSEASRNSRKKTATEASEAISSSAGSASVTSTGSSEASSEASSDASKNNWNEAKKAKFRRHLASKKEDTSEMKVEIWLKITGNDKLSTMKASRKGTKATSKPKRETADRESARSESLVASIYRCLVM